MPASQQSDRVYISYARGTDEHNSRCLDLADRLRREGVNSWIDKYNESPPEGWPQWTQTQIETAEFVIVVCTMPVRPPEETVAKDAAWEAFISRQIFFEKRSKNEQFVPVLFEDEHEEAIPTFLRASTKYTLWKEYDELYRRLTRQPSIVPPPLGARRLVSLVLPEGRRRTIALIVLLIFVPVFYWAILRQKADVLGSRDPGLNNVWGAREAGRIEFEMQSAPIFLRRAWPELKSRLDHFALAWTTIRETAHGGGLFSDEGSRSLAGQCLVSTRRNLESVLQAIRAAIHAPPGLSSRPDARPTVIWRLQIHRWLRTLESPRNCADRHYLSRLFDLTKLNDSPLSEEAELTSLYEKGLQHYFEYHLAEAEYFFRNTLRLGSGKPVWIARATYRLGLLEEEHGRPERALRQYELALEQARLAYDRNVELYIIQRIISLASDALADPKKSIDMYKIAMDGVGSTPWLWGDGDDVSELSLRTAWAVWQQAEDGQRADCPLGSPSEPCSEPKKCVYSCAMRLLDLAEDAAVDRGDAKIRIKINRAAIWAQLDELKLATSTAQEALQLDLSGGGASFETAPIHNLLYRVYTLRGMVKEAGVSAERELAVYTDQGKGETSRAAKAMHAVAIGALNRSDLGKARDLNERALAILRRPIPMRNDPIMLSILEDLGTLYLRSGTSSDERIALGYLGEGVQRIRVLPEDSAYASSAIGIYRILVSRLLRLSSPLYAERLITAALKEPWVPQRSEVRMELILIAVEIQVQRSRTNAEEMLGEVAEWLRHSPQTSQVSCHHDWLKARILGPEKPEALRLATKVRNELKNDPDLENEFLSLSAIQKWISSHQR